MSETTTVSVERRGHVLLIGINRPEAQNRIDPGTFLGLGKAYFAFEQDEGLRVAVLFGHGAHFSCGLDAPAFAPLMLSGRFSLDAPETINPLQTSRPRLTKPLIAVAHGNTFYMGHELFLAADVRVAAANAVFSQGEAAFALYAGGGGTVRFVRDAGWAKAMRYMLTADSWNVEESQRMSLVSDVAPTPETALQRALELANKIAAVPSRSARATLESAHEAVDDGEEKAFAATVPRFIELLRSEDFQERVRATREGRPPAYR